MSIWFTSDTHFGAERTLKLSLRPFDSVLEMDRALVGNWNNVVAPTDTVFHLGDFGDYSVASHLNGNIILIPGNYERHYAHSVELNEHLFSAIMKQNLVRTSIDYYWGDDLTFNVNMAHEPSHVRDMPIDDKTINLFGHIHKLCMVKRYGLNVGCDCHNFTPIDMDTVLHYHNAILNFYDNNVFE